MLLIYSIMSLIAISILETESSKLVEIFQGGGYTIKLCSVSYIELLPTGGNITCANSSEICTNGFFNLCFLRCMNYTSSIRFKYNKIAHSIRTYERPIIKLKKNPKKFYKSGDNISFTLETLLQLTTIQPNEIEIFFSNKISCGSKLVIGKLISCILDATSLNKYEPENINITYRFGSNCSRVDFIANIQVQNPSPLQFIKRFYWILIILFPIIIFVVIVYCIVSKNKTAKIDKNIFQKKLIDQQIKFTKCQRKAFLEYQISVTSFPNLGKFSPRHLHSFEEYMTRVLNVEFKPKLNKSCNEEFECFKNMLLNKNQLFVWIKQVEVGCRIQDRFLVSAYLTVFLFQYPEYFLEVMKDLLIQLATELKIKSPQTVMFQKPEYIIEMVVSNWLRLFMYDSLKDKLIGEKLFNLYRAVKCKINAGLVDYYTHKAKYAISNDYLLTTDQDYETLKIKAKVKVEMKLMDALENSVFIDLENIELEVLSLDTISQVIAKILDTAIMKYIELQTSNDPDKQSYQTFSATQHDKYLLYYKVNNAQMLLSNFDHTSISSTIENHECIIINTMKHYNIKSGTQLLLTSKNLSNACLQLPNFLERLLKVHLLLPKQWGCNSHEIQRTLSTESQRPLIFQPLKDSDDKVSHYMILLGTKKSLYPYINAFLQCITDWNPKETHVPSRDSLFNPNEESQILEEHSSSSNIFQPNYAYVAPVYYLFNILDEIWNSFKLENNIKLNLWKSYSFIYQFWMQMIQNPDFIFSVDKSIAVTDSLKTISDILRDTCLWTLENANSDQDSSPFIISRLFHEDIKNYYIQWWHSFIDRAHPINKADIVYRMSNMVKQYEMDIYNSCVLKNLHIISRTLLLEKSGT